MSFFNSIGRKTSEVTSKIARETKLRIKMSENKNKIADIYEEIGKKVYEKHIREQNIDIETELIEECGKIDEIAKEIEDARKEILKLNQKKMCAYCDSEIESSSKFCPKCGKKQKDNSEEIKEEKINKDINEKEIKKEENKDD